MAESAGLADRLAPDSIRSLERAAELRFGDAEVLRQSGGGESLLAAVYLYGYVIEMCLTAAYFRAAGLAPDEMLDNDTRRARMARLRQLLDESGKALMGADPHPLVGWAQGLRFQRRLVGASESVSRRLDDAIDYTKRAYRHWRPELRYKVAQVPPDQLEDVRRAAEWLLRQRGNL